MKEKLTRSKSLFLIEHGESSLPIFVAKEGKVGFEFEKKAP